MDWKHWVPSPLHLHYPWDGKDTAHQGWGERHLPSSPRPGFEPWCRQSWGGGWEGPTPASCPLGCDDHSPPPKKESNCKKYFKNSTCYFWFSPNLTLNSLLWIWKLSDNVVNQYIDAACIIYSENHMGGGRNHFWLQYMGRTSSSWGQSASHHHFKEILETLALTAMATGDATKPFRHCHCILQLA